MNLFNIDSAVCGQQRAGLKDGDARDVHVCFRIFEVEEGPVQGTQPFVLGHWAPRRVRIAITRF
ncbi:hypothetical protein [Candidatus Binatus sp.]|uniref:hypothetical protein n=1 Tax=Candidatus Binatus sp. TaxID=2811406 RepID=UPI003BB00114